jgi:hypothetical protein
MRYLGIDDKEVNGILLNEIWGAGRMFYPMPKEIQFWGWLLVLGIG